MRAISGQPERASKKKTHNNNETELRECTPKTGLNRSLGRLFPHAVHKIAFDSTFCRAEFKSPDFRPLGWPGQDTGLCDTGPEEPGAGWRAGGSSYRTLSLLLPCFVRDVLCCKTIFLLNLGFPIFAGPCPHGFRLWGCSFLSSLLPRSFYLYACVLGFIHRWSPKKQNKKNRLDANHVQHPSRAGNKTYSISAEFSWSLPFAKLPFFLLQKPCFTSLLRVFCCCYHLPVSFDREALVSLSVVWRIASPRQNRSARRRSVVDVQKSTHKQRYSAKAKGHSSVVRTSPARTHTDPGGTWLMAAGKIATMPSQFSHKWTTAKLTIRTVCFFLALSSFSVRRTRTGFYSNFQPTLERRGWWLFLLHRKGSLFCPFFFLYPMLTSQMSMSRAWLVIWIIPSLRWPQHGKTQNKAGRCPTFGHYSSDFWG